jgi:hypothetical protein
MLPARWKLFRLMCLFQMAFAGLSAGYALVFLLLSGSLFELLDLVCFTAIFLFAYLGQSLINYNYPDITPQGKQKRYFNILYIINFFLLSFIGAHVYTERWTVVMLMNYDFGLLATILLSLKLAAYLFILILQVYLLYGMFRLRRELYSNFTRSLEELAG